MTGKSRDAPKRAGKSKQTEPAETIPRDVEEFVGTIAHEVQSIARLARGLCEADASQESAALIKRRTRVSDEGVNGASRSLLDQPLGEILQKKNVHVAEDEAGSSVGDLATVIASRLNILLEFAQAVQKRNILGTPQGLQYLDKHRTAHYPRIVPLVEPTAGHSQLVEEIERLKEDNALIQKEADEFAHDLGKREADAEVNSVSSSRQPRRRLLGIHLWIALPVGVFVVLALTASISWSSAKHYYGVAEQAKRYEARLQEHNLKQVERIRSWMIEGRFQDALILADGLSADSPQSEFSEAKIDVIMALLTEAYDGYDLSKVEAELRSAGAGRLTEDAVGGITIMSDTLCDALKDLEDLICGEVVEHTTGVTAAVTQSVWDDHLDADTQSAIDKIDRIHDGAVAPSFTPSNAGDENATVDTSSMTTEQMGGDACERALAAYAKACDDPSDHEAASTSLYEVRDVLVDLRAQADPT